jgi:very-short-patch-repair endonuclease
MSEASEHGGTRDVVEDGLPPDEGDRATRVRRAIGIWRRQLIDLGARNNLLYFRDLKQGTISFDDARPSVVGELLARRKVRLSRLFPEAVESQARRARTIRKKAQELFEERGLETLYLACGLATWETPGPGATPLAPVLLAPIRLLPRGGTQEDFDLDISGELEVNPTLLHLLANDFRVECSPEELLSHTEFEGAIDTPDELGAVYRWLERHAASVPGFRVDERMVLGTFAYAKLPMVNDLAASEEALIEHDLVAAIAGDPGAREALRGRISDVDATEPNRIPPADEFLILDADSSQNWAINACLAGQDLIVRGPPGTGKSQTIANLIATLIAKDKRVLFVAEKRAAIDAVLSRLDGCGLSDLVLDLHGGSGSKKKLAQALKQTLDSHANLTLPRLEEHHAELAARRDQLNRREEALHRRREPWDVSVYEIQAELLGLDETAELGERFGQAALTKLARPTYLAAREELRQWAALGGSTLATGDSPWRVAEIVSADDARAAFELVGRLHDQTLPAAERLLTAAASDVGQTLAQSAAGWRSFVTLCGRADTLLERFQPGLFERDLAADTVALAPAGRGVAARSMAQLTSGDYRQAKAALRTLTRPETSPDTSELLLGCQDGEALKNDWQPRSLDSSMPAAPANLEHLSAVVLQLEEELSALGRMAGHDGLANMPLDDVRATLSSLRTDQITLFKLPELHRLRLALLGKGLEELLARIEHRALTPDLSVVALDRAWLSSIYEYVAPSEAEIGAFDGQAHLATVEGFRAADHAHIESTAVRVRRAAAERATLARDHYADEATLVAQQAARKIGHKPVREMFAGAPHVIGALKPCWVMSPLVVSQLLPTASGEPPFDVVIFDEASQITQPDAIPAILRGRRIIVAGDELQLPPTSFFASSDPQSEEEEEAEAAALDHDLAATEGFESILQTLDGLVSSRMLTWHYRSKDERLIAFSNANLYDRSLTTFPGVAGDECLSHELISFSPPIGDDTLSVADEVNRVVDLILEHAKTRPHETLGVIAMGIKHANRIDEALRQRRADRPEIEEFFAETREERFFVKNLERVQGDERDAIILTIGYGKDQNGRLPYRFGPLLYDGGHRRLNVAVTRARQRMTLVSSFSHTDMDPDRAKSDGVRLLRDYLEYAHSRGNQLNASAYEKPALNPFEIDVRDQLTRAGIPLIAQHGSSGFRIDFAAKHPDRPGEFVLAIECDGASYHSSATARDRDRLRQEQLERLNWRFHRIWSTDWFRNRDAEIARAVLAYREAVADSDARLDEPVPAAHSTPSPAAFTRPTVDAQTVSRSPRPSIPTEVTVKPRSGGRSKLRKRRLDEYSQQELVTLVRWIESDTKLRTEAELVTCVLTELDFKQHRGNYDASILAAIRSARRVG